MIFKTQETKVVETVIRPSDVYRSSFEYPDPKTRIMDLLRGANRFKQPFRIIGFRVPMNEKHGFVRDNMHDIDLGSTSCDDGPRFIVEPIPADLDPTNTNAAWE